MTPRKFCVLTMPRCGSNALCSLLDQAPDTICHGELFNRNGIWTARQPRLDLPHTVADRDRDPLTFLRDIERETLKQAVTFGFKLFFMRSSVVREHVISSEEYRIILLFRPNKLAQFSSLALARASGVWHTPNSRSGEAMPTVHFDKEEFRAFVHYVDKRYGRVKSALATHSKAHFAIEYQNIKSERALEALADFLGMDRDGSWSDRFRRIPHVRQNAPVIIDRFSNPEDVVAAMREIGREEWLEAEVQTTHV